jgi:uncharacterized membrane protein
MMVPYVILLGAGVAIVVTALLAASGRLPRNHLAGIRTPNVMCSEQTWRAGHTAAAPWLLAAGSVVTAGSVALLTMRPNEVVGGLCLFVLAVFMGVLVAVATRVAGRAARGVG